MKRSKCSLTIVTTFFNPDAYYLSLTLDSIFEQTDSDFTFFLYDDCSVENSKIYEIIEKFCSKCDENHKKIKVIRQRGQVNLGVDLAHSYCFSQVNTDFFMWLDCGDLLLPNFVRDFRKIASKKQAIDIFHLNDFCYQEKLLIKSKDTISAKNIKQINRKNQLINFIFHNNFFYHCFVVKTSTFLKLIRNNELVNGMNFERSYYDFQIMFLAVLYSCNFFTFRNAYALIYEDPNSVSRQSINFQSTGSRYDMVKQFIQNSAVSQRRKRKILKLYEFMMNRKYCKKEFEEGNYSTVRKIFIREFLFSLKNFYWFFQIPDSKSQFKYYIKAVFKK